MPLLTRCLLVGDLPGIDQLGPVVDRITFNAHILETGPQSYRLRTSKTHHRKRA
jgi:hypothetical protein